MLLSIIYVGIATIAHSLIVVLAGAARGFFADRRRDLILRRVLSVLLAGVALWFAFETGLAQP